MAGDSTHVCPLLLSRGESANIHRGSRSQPVRLKLRGVGIHVFFRASIDGQKFRDVLDREIY